MRFRIRIVFLIDTFWADFFARRAYCAGSWKFCVRQVFVVRGAVIKAIWTFSKFSLIPLWKGFGGVTHGSLLDPEFGRFTSDKAHFSDQNEAQILEFLRKKRIRRPGSRLNAIIVSLSKANRHRRTPFGPPLPCGCNLVVLKYKIV